MRVVIVTRNQNLSMMWKLLKVLGILIRTLYLVLSPFMLVKILLMMKVMNLFYLSPPSKTDSLPSSSEEFSPE